MGKKIIITGAPGTGKTSIINHLLNLGYSCSKEVSREIIKEEISSEGEVLPWINLAEFSKRVFSLRKKQYINAPENSLHFFDRGILDVISYMKTENLPISKYYQDECEKYKYNTTVFYTPIWKEIYKNDLQRKEDIYHAIAIEEALLDTYRSYGYCMKKIPKMSIKKRVDFIISKI